MLHRWLHQACRFYLALVVGVAIFCAVLAAWTFIPGVPHRGYMLALGRAWMVSVLATLLLSVVGGFLCVVCVRSKVEPPDILAHCTLASIVLFVLAMISSPAISGP
jgi:hypothetical protein